MLKPQELATLVVDHVTEHPEQQEQDCARLGCCYKNAMCLAGWTIHFAGIPYSSTERSALVEVANIPAEIIDAIDPAVVTNGTVGAAQVTGALLDLSPHSVAVFFNESDKEIALDRFKDMCGV